ncbi:hypothetical protein [uncultured Fibrella sp.]|uniref:hypothetical protein n=1 Tax=uncultured Fibrella sp. TaxID=1284596 RepID=UPI0035C9DA0A
MLKRRMDLKSIADKVQHEVNVVQGNEARDVSYVSQNTFANDVETDNAFARSVEKLLHVNGWSGLSNFTADFELYDQHGQRKPDGKADIGDYIKIVLPGPMPENWVRVIDCSAKKHCVDFTVQPTHDPASPNPEQVDHFFSNEARSIFRVERVGTTITASEIGRHEAINNQQPAAGDRAIVNTAIAEGGWLFYQKLQWKLLTDCLVHL